MTGLKEVVYTPNPEAHAVYQELYKLYHDLHDAFGTKEWNGNLYHVMKKLLDLRDNARK
jgi:L-ribulokinase